MAIQIVSGGQTGADRGGLDAAIELGLEQGGWCPKGRRAEDGAIPQKYALAETSSEDYSVRTLKNVLDSDGTVILTLSGPPEPQSGTALTAEYCRQNGKPLLLIDLSLDAAKTRRALRAWLKAHSIQSLNVAGPRESSAPGIQTAARDFLISALPRNPRME